RGSPRPRRDSSSSCPRSRHCVAHTNTEFWRSASRGARRVGGIRVASLAAGQRGGRGLTFGRRRSISDPPSPPAIGRKAAVLHARTLAMTPTRKPLRRPDEPIAAGLIPPDRRGEIEAGAARSALALTADVAELIDPADPRDPIARQFVPAAAELDARPEEMADPIGDDAHSPVEGVVHRY